VKERVAGLPAEGLKELPTYGELSHTPALSHTHSRSLSLPLSLTHTPALSLSLSLSHTPCGGVAGEGARGRAASRGAEGAPHIRAEGAPRIRAGRVPVHSPVPLPFLHLRFRGGLVFKAHRLGRAGGGAEGAPHIWRAERAPRIRAGRIPVHFPPLLHLRQARPVIKSFPGSRFSTPQTRAREGLKELPTYGELKGLPEYVPDASRCTLLRSRCSTFGSEAGSYLRLIDCVYHSTLGLRVIKKKRRGFSTFTRATIFKTRFWAMNIAARMLYYC